MKEGIEVSQKAITSLLKKHGFTLTTINVFDGGFINPIYFLSTKAGTDLVLKITHPLWPIRKTVNEATVIKFVANSTSIPVPEIITWSASKEELGYEYILMKRVRGKPLSSFFASLTKEEQMSYLDQMADYVEQLMSIRFENIGAFKEQMEVTANVYGSGPYKTLAGYLDGEMTRNLAELHKNQEYIDLAKRFNRFKEEVLRKYKGSCTIVLAHNDILCKNIMGNEGKITAILDWEWAMAAPSDVYFNAFSDLSEAKQRYFYSVLSSKGIHSTEEIEARSHLYKADHLLMCLACYKEWMGGDHQKEEEYEKDLLVGIEHFLTSHGM